MDNRPIGMFDSGVGGLTVYKEIKKQLPNENITYLGDTKRFPYGSKSKESIIDLTKKGIEFLISKNVKLIVIACGTATSQALQEVKDEYTIQIIGIIEPTIDYLEKKYSDKEKGTVGIIATRGTIRSNGWQNSIKQNIKNVDIAEKECPLLAPMAEEGWTDNEIAKLTVKEYLKNMKDVDTLILGCTHYPLFEDVIKEELGENVEIINTGHKIADNLKSYLLKNGIEAEDTQENKDEIYLTDTECNFINVATKLLKDNNVRSKIKKVE